MSAHDPNGCIMDKFYYFYNIHNSDHSRHASAMPANIYKDFGTAHHQAVWSVLANLGPGIRGLKLKVTKLQILWLT